MSYTLAIDTSLPELSLALENSENSEVYELLIETPDSHNEHIASGASELLKRASISFSEISKIVVGAGPGSFTGLRIGFAFAKGLAFALKCPLFGISSLLAAAYEFRGEGDLIVTLVDARRNEAFRGVYQGKSLAPVLQEGIIKLSDLGLELCAPELSKRYHSIVLVSKTLDLKQFEKRFQIKSPQHISRSLAELSKEIEGKYSLDELSEAHPNYIRQPSAKTIAERLGAGLL